MTCKGHEELCGQLEGFFYLDLSEGYNYYVCTGIKIHEAVHLVFVHFNYFIICMFYFSDKKGQKEENKHKILNASKKFFKCATLLQ